MGLGAVVDAMEAVELAAAPVDGRPSGSRLP